jgi:hypothetical protein
MNFKIGDYVRISSEYPFDTTLQNQTGVISATPTRENPDKYLIKFDGGITQNTYLKDKLIWVPLNWLEAAKRIRPTW